MADTPPGSVHQRPIDTAGWAPRRPGVRAESGCGTTPGTCSDGAEFPANVARALCDWYDVSTVGDDDSERSGNGDGVSHTIDVIFDTMSGAYEHKGESSVISNGFTICDFVGFHADVEGGTSTAHTDTIANNGFDCN